VARWYGAEGRSVEVVSNSALWYSTGLPAVALRWVLIPVIPKESSELRRSFAPTSAPIPRGSSRGS
jgi:hypothetical protein